MSAQDEDKAEYYRLVTLRQDAELAKLRVELATANRDNSLLSNMITGTELILADVGTQRDRWRVVADELAKNGMWHTTRGTLAISAYDKLKQSKR